MHKCHTLYVVKIKMLLQQLNSFLVTTLFRQKAKNACNIWIVYPFLCASLRWIRQKGTILCLISRMAVTSPNAPKDKRCQNAGIIYAKIHKLPARDNKRLGLESALTSRSFLEGRQSILTTKCPFQTVNDKSVLEAGRPWPFWKYCVIYRFLSRKLVSSFLECKIFPKCENRCNTVWSWLKLQRQINAILA